MKTIKISLSAKSVDNAIKELKAYKADLRRKCMELCERLAAIGATKASIDYSRATYTGPKDIAVSVEPTDNGYKIVASGGAVLFVEFGAGVKYGDGHPLNDEFGYGPGTYPIPPGKGHWDDPRGWWLPKAKGGGHTFGNPPSMTMYQTGRDLRKEVKRVAEEVFRSND